MKNKSILVTGGSGFIGSHFIDLLIKKKFKIVNIDLIKNNFFEKNIKYKDYKLIKCNICSKIGIKKIFKKFKFDYVVNFAAESHVDKSIYGPVKFFQTNLFGTLNLLENVRNFQPNTRFIQISTDEVFGSLKKNDKPFTSKSIFKPNSPYSASKAAADHLVRSYFKTYKINVSSTHSSNNFGERQNPEKLIPMTLTSLANDRLIPIYGNGKNIRDWIYVGENCRAIFDVMTKGIPGKNYLIGSNNEINNLEIIKKIIFFYSKLQNKKILFRDNVKFVNDRLGHDYRYSVDIKELLSEFNFKYKKNFDFYLKKTINHYYNNQKYYKKLETINKWFYDKYKKYKKK